MVKKNLLIFVLVIAMTLTLAGCGGEKAPEAPTYTDGVYEGTGEGKNGEITVSVEVKDGKIASVDILSHDETDGISDPAREQVPASIVEKNSTEVDTVSGATLTSEGIIEAVNEALEKAQ
ncbi:MAG: FMN-binding protein [Tissierellaceae bacterium]